MTIKQQGGIFGRNPTFNDVTIGDVEVTGTSKLTGNVGIGTAPSTEALTVAGKVTSTTSGYTVNSTYPLFGYYNVGPVGYVQAPASGNFEVWADSTGAIAKFKDNLDVEIVSGNLVIGTSGKGIDFSATSGTGTSELFDDYEEGTWTPSVSSTLGTITTVGGVVGRYVKVGRVVHAFWQVAITTNGTGAGAITISSLPFAASNAVSFYAGGGYGNNTGYGLTQALLTTSGPIYVRNADGTYPGASGEVLYGFLTYEV